MRSRALIVGLAKDVEPCIRRSLATIQRAFSSFDCRWLVIESDSTDRTAEILRRSGLDCLSLGKLSDVIPERTKRIAYCRNIYLERIRSHFRNVDYVVVADLDGINNRLTERAVLSCFERSDWSVVTANQEGPYYDVYALRHATWCPDDWWTQHNFARNLGVSEEESIRFACHSRMLRIPLNAPWIEVESAFGGLAIYRRDALENSASYDGDGICEHVPFHRALRADGHSIHINPKLINAAYTEHTLELVGRRELRYIMESLKRIVAVRTRGGLRAKDYLSLA